MTGSERSCRALRKTFQVSLAASSYWHILQSAIEGLRRDLEYRIMAFMPSSQEGSTPDQGHGLVLTRWF